SMRKIRCAIERIHVPAILAARVHQPVFLTQNVMGGPFFLDSLADQRFRTSVGLRYQIRVAFVLNLHATAEENHKQYSRFTRNFLRGGNILICANIGWPRLEWRGVRLGVRMLCGMRHDLTES